MTTEDKSAAEIAEEIKRLTSVLEAKTKQEKDEGLGLLKEFLAKHKLTNEDAITYLGGSTKKTKAATPATKSDVIWEYKSEDGKTHWVKSGLKGQPTWEEKGILKETLTEEQARACIKAPEGEAFVKRVYHPKNDDATKAAAKKKTTKKKG